jgi:hypothetical protein
MSLIPTKKEQAKIIDMSVKPFLPGPGFYSWPGQRPPPAGRPGIHSWSGKVRRSPAAGRCLVPTCLFLWILFTGAGAQGQELTIDPKLYHLRNGDLAEWAEFARQADGNQLTLPFQARANQTHYTLCLRQQDVKQDWTILLNGREIGKLALDEKDMFWYVDVPPNTLKTGANSLLISTTSAQVDDIRVGQLVLAERPMDTWLNEAALQVEVREEGGIQGLPCRITITNLEGTLQPIRAQPGQHLAIRPGYVYSGDGKAVLGLPAGTYRIYATRGMEYGVDSADVVLKPGGQAVHKLVINRQVPTTGWVSSDTHVHTFTYSGHGDATIAERALSLAGEGIELPVITDHNVIVDIRPVARQMGVDKFFTAVSGIETTTSVGHFNIFPVAPNTPVPDFRVKDWDTLSRGLAQVAGLEAIILNHARDIHAGFRPFDPQRHLAVAGRTLTGWHLPANAMEVINSGATQTNNMQLYWDWFGMLNGGHQLTPVGASDSHDVSRYLVGQARTYIRSQNQDPGQINTAEAIANFKAGKVMVSFGLLAEMVVNAHYGPGELAPAPGEVLVAVQVLGPAWAKADKVTLYANGREIQQSPIRDPGAGGVKWRGTWKLPRPRQDLFLVAVAEGPGGHLPFWPIGKPYQPRSPDWVPRVMGSTGAVWIDGDGDKQFTSALAYAQELTGKFQYNLPRLIKKLKAYDESVALQVASQLQLLGTDVAGPQITELLKKASPPTKAGFEHFALAWKRLSH